MPLTTPKSPRSGSTKIPPLAAGRTSAEGTESRPTSPACRTTATSRSACWPGKNMLDVVSTSSHGATGSCAQEGTPRLLKAGWMTCWNAHASRSPPRPSMASPSITPKVSMRPWSPTTSTTSPDTSAWCSTTVQSWPSISTPWARPVRKTRPSSTTLRCPCCRRSFLAWSMWKHVGHPRGGRLTRRCRKTAWTAWTACWMLGKA